MPDTLVQCLREALTDTQSDTLALILYLPFGVVRGEISRTTLQPPSTSEGDTLLALQKVVVEHSSNHLPTGLYDNLYVNPREVAGVVILKE